MSMSRSMSRGHARVAVVTSALLLHAACRDAPGVVSALEPLSVTTLAVASEEARIVRDGFGTPHIFAETNRALFEAYGFAVAQDRLWQLELNRRAATGRLSEIFGASTLAADRLVRTVGYTGEELDSLFARMPPDEQAIYQAYAAGINRYLAEVVAADPARRLPFEFHALGFEPGAWTVRDSMAFGAFMLRRFGEIGGRELTNQALLSDLTARHGPAAGQAIFDDVRWLNDPDSPVTVPATGAVGRRQKPEARPLREQVGAEGERWAAEKEEARRTWESLGVPVKLGSYAWVVSAARSSEGAAMLYGGPQMGFSAPEVLHEVQLTGGDGFNVVGMAFAGVPPVLIGRNAHVAWTSTTATGDNLDLYLETLCDAGAGPGSGHLFGGSCRPLEKRVETIAVRGGPPQSLTVLRSVHGPIVGTSGGLAVSEKRAHWLRETEGASAFLAFDRARNVHQFEAAVRRIVTSHNFLYADRQGDIAYWQAGQVPLRPAGFDPRLPLPGDGSAEWPGGILAMPRSVNPAQGWLANWNNKPQVDYDNADEQIFGKQNRLLEIAARLSAGRVSLADMREIPRDIARVGGLGREARYLRPHLLAALDASPPAHPVAPQARAVLQAWGMNAFADAVSSTQLEAGEVLFSTWLGRAIREVFADELGTVIGEGSSNMLLHALDFAATGRSGVPPSRDYFNGEPPGRVLSRAFDQAVGALASAQGTDPRLWSAPRPTTTFRHPLLGPVAAIPASNRATFAQIVVLARPRPRSESIFTLGQSGLVSLVPPAGFALDPHFLDQLPLYTQFEYKPMVLLPRGAAGD